MKKPGLTGWILIAMGAGCIIGLVVHYNATEAWKTSFSSGISVVTDIFLRLIKMIIAPLVFSTLVVGIAKLCDIRTVGRIGAKTLIWFITASLFSLVLGLVVMNLTKLGQNLHLPVPEESQASSLEQSALSFRNFITHVFPRSVVEAIGIHERLQIVVFSIFFCNAKAAIGEKGKVVIRGRDAVSHVI